MGTSSSTNGYLPRPTSDGNDSEKEQGTGRKWWWLWLIPLFLMPFLLTGEVVTAIFSTLSHLGIFFLSISLLAAWPYCVFQAVCRQAQNHPLWSAIVACNRIQRGGSVEDIILDIVNSLVNAYLAEFKLKLGFSVIEFLYSNVVAILSTVRTTIATVGHEIVQALMIYAGFLEHILSEYLYS
ncbi:hypothetical protein TruAng_007392 [Truncatella angustata]|nr:hypothetical protein TruAng_007392 [Truncatella angustata]